MSKKKAPKPAPSADETPEARLADYWRARTGLAWSDFDVFAGKQCPKGTTSRIPVAGLEVFRTRPFFEFIDMIGDMILRGYPLSREEYHVALAVGYLLGDFPYEEFYREHWHENAARRGYGPADDGK